MLDRERSVELDCLPAPVNPLDREAPLELGELDEDAFDDSADKALSIGWRHVVTPETRKIVQKRFEFLAILCGQRGSGNRRTRSVLSEKGVMAPDGLVQLIREPLCHVL